MSQPTRVIVETPEGRGAVAVVRVVGDGAVAAVDGCFLAANSKPLAEQPAGGVRFGRWQHDAGEELVVCRVDAMTVEVHCHGGRAAVRAVVRSLAERGAVEQPWREALGGSIADDARRVLADCTTDRAAAVLMDQLAGALERETLAAIEHTQGGNRDDAIRAVRALLARAPVGLHLAAPWRVVLAGPPNVGKSSLVNALVGYERSIVFDQPGVTRDVVTAAAAVDGWPVELADTAGLRAPEGEIEAAGIQLARSEVSRAELIVLVEAFGDEPPPGQTPAEELLAKLGLAVGDSANLLRVANKRDLSPPEEWPEQALAVSATSGAGVKELVAAIGGALVPEPPEPGAGVPFVERQVQELRAAAQSIDAGDNVAAVARLQALLAPA